MEEQISNSEKSDVTSFNGEQKEHLPNGKFSGLFRAVASYFKESAKEFSDIKKIALAGMFLAMSVALQGISIPLDPSRTLWMQVTFIVSMLSGLVLGPLLSLLRGAGSDLIGFLLFPQGPFFPGYTLSAALGAMVYSLFFWRRRVNSLSILGAKVTVSVFVNAALGSLWNVILYGTKAYGVYFGFSLSKNLIFLPIEVLVATVVFKAMAPILSKFGLIKSGSLDSLKIWKKQTVIAVIVLAILAVLMFFFGSSLYKALKNFVNLIFSR